MKHRWFLPLVTSMLVTTVAHAGEIAGDREGSRAAFRRGVSAVTAGSFEEARTAFRRAYELFPHPSILFNLGLAEAKLGAWGDAEAHLTQFLREDTGSTSAERATAAAELAHAEQKLGWLLCATRPGQSCRVDGIAAPLTEQRVAIGRHEVEFLHDGKRVLVVAFVDAQQHRRVDLPMPMAIQAPRSTATIGVGFVVVGGLALGAATATGLKTLALSEAYRDRTGPQYQDAGVRSQGISYRTATDVLLVSGLVAAGIGVVFLIPRSPPPRSTALRFLPGGIHVQF